MVLDTEKQIDESIASLLKECAESDEEGLGGVLKVVTALAEFMDMDNTMEVLNGLLYHDNEKIALNSLSIFRHLHETGYINLQPIALSRIEDGEELVEPIDEEDNLPEDATITPEIEEMQGDMMEEEIPTKLPSEDIPMEESIEFLDMPEDVMGGDISEESMMPIEMGTGEEESMVGTISENTEIENIVPETDITLEEENEDDFEFQVPEISTFIPIGETGEEENIEEDIEGTVGDTIAEEMPEIGMEDSPIDDAGESPFGDMEEPAPIGDIASPFDDMGEEPPSPFNEAFELEPEEKKIKLPSISAIEGEAKEQWEETVDKIARLKEKYINK